MDAQYLIERALELHQKGQLDQAADLYDQALKLDRRNFAALQYFGVLRAQQGRHVEATRMIEAALALKPDDQGVLLNYGQMLMGQARPKEALAAFDRVLAARPIFYPALFNRGVALSELKRFAEAVTTFDKALAANPKSVECLYNRGIAQNALGWREEALASYQQAVTLHPGFAAAWHNRGNVLRELGRMPEALESHDKAAAAAPGNPLIHYSRGTVLAELGRRDDSIAAFDKALEIQPGFTRVLNSRAGILLAQGRFAEALADLDQALILDAGNAESLNNRGVALHRLGRTQEAHAAYGLALATAPGHVESLLNRAFLLQALGDLDLALADYQAAISLAPENARGFNGRGSVLHALKREREALSDFDRALALDPTSPDAHANRAHLRWSLHSDYEGAVADLKAALAANPDQAYARGELLHLKMFAADWEDFEGEKNLVDAGVRAGKLVVRPFVYQAVSSSPADLQACSRLFAQSLFPDLPAPAPFAPRQGKIRIGYVSGEFREQATAYLMAGLYEWHDRARFEVVAIDNGGGDGSAMRRRLEAGFDKIIYINKMSDAEASERIRVEKIDILVNLNGYFGAPRMGVFARRSAPVQVNYLGFPATLGAPYMDYIIADSVVIPPGEECFYDEKVVRLPYSYQANDAKRAVASDVPTRAGVGLPETGFVFCNFNQSYKLTPGTFASWMRILKAVEGSMLWLQKGTPPYEANLAREAKKHGLASSRLVFAPPMALDRHLARLQLADLFLDNLPYNAHTTASDALWAGLPLVTQRGTAFPGRVAASLLAAVGLPELITDSADDYERLAIRLARDAAALAALKQKLAANRSTTPLFDTGLFCRHLESAYAAMWEACEKRQAPRGFTVPA